MSRRYIYNPHTPGIPTSQINYQCKDVLEDIEDNIRREYRNNI